MRVSLCVCVHVRIVLKVTSQYRRIHPETPGPHHTKTFHIPPTTRTVSLREQQSPGLEMKNLLPVYLFL